MKKQNEVYVVNTCNAWKEYSSFRLVGIFTTRRKLNPVLNKLLKSGDIIWNYDKCTMRYVNRLNDNDLHNQLKYISVQVITLNEEQ